MHGAIKFNNEWITYCWNLNGSAILNSENEYDLIEVKPRIQRDVWLDIYADAVVAGIAHKTRIISDGRIACVKITIDCEEGEGL